MCFTGASSWQLNASGWLLDMVPLGFSTVSQMGCVCLKARNEGLVGGAKTLSSTGAVTVNVLRPAITGFDIRM